LYDSDRALAARMCAADQRAFDEFFHANVPRLLAFATRYSGLDKASVEDVVQNTLIKAMRSLSTYRGEASLYTWLTQICLHELLDTLRKRARRPALVSLQDIEGLWRSLSELRVPRTQEPPAEMEAELHRAAVLNVLQSLPHRYAQVLEAKYGDGLAVEQIAAMMGVTNTTVQSLLARARDAFKSKWLATMGPEKEVSSS
jgi:RNA polymerase sigma-70 factor (ECF subfamily)